MVPPFTMAIEYKPTVKEVSALLHSRTPNRWGKEQSEFNDDTHPTKSQVEELITDAVNEVSGEIGDLEQDKEEYPCVVRMRERAKSAVKLYVCMLIEISYQPEQTTGNLSPYQNLEKLYNKKMEKLSLAVKDCVGEDSVVEDGAGTTGGLPSGNFDGLDGVGERDW